MSKLTDEILLKRSDHARRNLAVLASLASVVAVVMVAALVFAKGMLATLLLPACGMLCIAIGYWYLAVAAKRGNPNSIAIVMIAAALNIALSLIVSGIMAASTGVTFQPNVGGFIIPILIIVALNNSRKVLLELKERGLWAQVFGAAKPSAQLCIIGGTLVAAGFLAFNGSFIYMGKKVGEERQSEQTRVNDFVALVQVQEEEFMVELQTFVKSRGKDEGQAALLKVDALQKRVDELQLENGDKSPFGSILSNYGNAVRQWKNGVVILNDPNGDTEEAQKHFVLGDKLKKQAVEEFDRRYARKQ